MSLRGRILALFLGLGVAPILLLGAFGYAQSLRAVRGLLETQTSSIARQVVRAIQDRHDLRLSELLLLAENTETQRLYRVPGGTGSPTPASTADAPETYLTEVWNRIGGSYAHIRFVDRQGRTLFSLGNGRAVGGAVEGSRPTPVELSSTVHLLVPVLDLETGENLGAVEAAVRAGMALPLEALESGFGRSGYLVVMDRRENEILYHPRRGLIHQPLSGLLGSEAGVADPGMLDADDGAFTYEERDSSRVASFVSLQEPPWTVISSTTMEEFAPPFLSARRVQILMVLLLVPVVAGAFLVTTGRATASLEVLTEASERIGKGDLSPPLPSPGPDEIGRLSASFELMVGQVREMLRRVEETRHLALMGEFASNISHEIRNPLTSIKLNLQGLDETARAEGLSDSSLRSLQICLREIGHLERAVRKILDMARTHPPTRIETSLHQVLSESVELLRAQLSAQGVEVRADLGASSDLVLADPEELKSVFVNLLLNAQEAMPDGGTVEISTGNPPGAEVPATIRVAVSDDGPGVPDEVREQIFRPFVTTKRDGTGFGLAVARLAVQDHDGWIRLESREGANSGASFVVELPVVSPHRFWGRTLAAGEQ